MKQGYTHISVVLDRSGSMAECASDTVGGFNRFVSDQKQVPGQATLTLVQFDTEYEIVHDCIDIQKVPPLDFRPRGNTALLDAFGKAIVTTGEWLGKKAEEERPEHVVFVVLTDGHENASKEFSKAKVRDLVKQQSDTYKWQFVFLGANIDSIDEGGQIGVAAAMAMNYNPKNVKAAYGVVSKNLSAVR